MVVQGQQGQQDVREVVLQELTGEDKMVAEQIERLKCKKEE